MRPTSSKPTEGGRESEAESNLPSNLAKYRRLSRCKNEEGDDKEVQGSDGCREEPESTRLPGEPESYGFRPGLRRNCHTATDHAIEGGRINVVMFHADGAAFSGVKCRKIF